ncbi:MAG: hypothetical protein H7Z40_08800 [Phycisphaerae bacterium]|nr:hypothetical protein [Gemmatimonadaceae bacterium]
MTNDRKYDDDEIRQILELALDREDHPAVSLPPADGLTLVQLQDVGREVGLPAARIAQAVVAFEGRGAPVPRGTTLGLPTSLGRIIPLSRNLSEREWELLVAELRTTFGGKGEVSSQGGLREWSYGNLHAFTEPTESGYRLRLTDANGAVVGIVFGGFVLSFALFILMTLLYKDAPKFAFAFPAFLSLIGGGLVAGSIISLPKWARIQDKRMEHIGGFVAALLARGEPSE